jgi:hypothetical protein
MLSWYCFQIFFKLYLQLSKYSVFPIIIIIINISSSSSSSSSSSGGGGSGSGTFYYFRKNHVYLT